MSSLPGGPSTPLLHLSTLPDLAPPLSGSLPDRTPQAQEVVLTSLDTTYGAVELTSSAPSPPHIRIHTPLRSHWHS